MLDPGRPASVPLRVCLSAYPPGLGWAEAAEQDVGTEICQHDLNHFPAICRPYLTGSPQKGTHVLWEGLAELLSSEHGTCKTVKARCWPWLALTFG